MANYYPQYYPQFPQYQPQPMQQQSGMIWVGSSLEAEQYLMAPNSAVTLWDKNAPAVYIKQTDASGRPSMKTYDLVERMPAPPPAEKPSIEYAAKADLEAVKAEFEALVARVEALSTPTPKKSKKEAEE